MDISLETQLDDSVTETEQRSIERCVRQISTTVRGTAPFLRDMGIEKMFPETNSPIEQSGFISDMITEIGEWEDRINVESAEFINENEIKVVIESGEPE